MRTPTRIVLAAALAAGACSAPPAARDGGLAARVDSLVTAYQRTTYAPAVSVAVVRAGRDTLVFRGYGTADVENAVAAAPATVYRTGSIGKQFTAAAVMRLVEEKRISLDEPIGRRLPDLPEAWRGVLVRQLLNHTAGIPNYTERPDYPRVSLGELTPDSVIALARGAPLDFAPGTSWKYSNTGYVLLAMLVRAASDQSFAPYLETGILRPLHLADTRYCTPEELVPRRAAGYMRRDTGVVNALDGTTSGLGDGELCSTVGDMAAWNLALATGRVVAPASWARMTTPEGAAVPAGYGYGLALLPIDGHPAIWHNGGVRGFRSDNAYLPADSLSVTVLTNLGSEPPHELFLAITRAALRATD